MHRRVIHPRKQFLFLRFILLFKYVALCRYVHIWGPEVSDAPRAAGNQTLVLFKNSTYP